MAGDGAEEGDQVVVVGCAGGGEGCLTCWYLERERMLSGREKGGSCSGGEEDRTAVATGWWVAVVLGGQ